MSPLRRHLAPLRRTLALLLALLPGAAAATEPLCLWVSSYHRGYEWNDGIERGIEEAVKGACRLERFFMDTKRNKEEAFGRAKALQALSLIHRLDPEVVILSDDNASRYLALPHLKESGRPLVFCGINWETERYGYPWANATGMVEVAPVLPLLKEIKQAVAFPKRGLYLSSAVVTERYDAKHYQRLFATAGVEVEVRLVESMEAWIEGYREGQAYDFLVLGNYAGINDWDPRRAEIAAHRHARRITVTNYDWMMPYAMVGKIKMPEEQGRWAGEVAAELLDGAAIGDIPVVANRRWNLYVNPALLEHAEIELEPSLLRSAIKVGGGHPEQADAPREEKP